MDTVKKGITVYCASSDDIPAKYFEVARTLGAEIASHGLPVINGGGKMGLMAAVSDGALDAGGKAIGVIPRFMVDAGRNYQRLTSTIITDSMHSRKRTMADLSVGAIALPGGIGTFEELLEMMTWRKLHLYNGEVVILNIDGYYDPLLQMLRVSVDQGFTSEHPHCWQVAATPQEAVNIIVENAHRR